MKNGDVIDTGLSTKTQPLPPDVKQKPSNYIRVQVSECGDMEYAPTNGKNSSKYQTSDRQGVMSTAAFPECFRKPTLTKPMANRLTFYTGGELRSHCSARI